MNVGIAAISDILLYSVFSKDIWALEFMKNLQPTILLLLCFETVYFLRVNMILMFQVESIPKLARLNRRNKQIFQVLDFNWKMQVVDIED